MKRAIIIHGTYSKDEYYDPKYPAASNFHWIPWLQRQIQMKDIDAYTPEIPRGYDPQYDIWKKELERYEVDADTTLVGHSCGGGFLVRWLSENPSVSVNRVVLVAPWLDPDRSKTTDFFEFTIDRAIAARTNGLHIFHSLDDDASIQKSVDTIRESVDNVEYKEFTNHGHFILKHMGTDAFPELLQTVLGQ